MNQQVINQIAKNRLRSKPGRVGQEPMVQPEPGFIQFDPEWARLKRLELLKVNWGKLYNEAKQHVTDKKLLQQIEQAYTSFRKWTAPYRSWTDVMFGEFPVLLTKQMTVYNQYRDKALPYIHKAKQVSQTIPGSLLERTPPQKLSQAFGGFTTDIGKGLLILGALWIFVNAGQKKNGRSK